jgi:hypothetical protein
VDKVGAEHEIELEVTPEAGRRIRGRGGRLFVWQTPVGAWLRDDAAFEPPADVAFHTLFDAGVEVGVGEDVDVRDTVRVTAKRWPGRGVKVLVDGKVWGRRGEAAGGDP